MVQDIAFSDLFAVSKSKLIRPKSSCLHHRLVQLLSILCIEIKDDIHRLCREEHIHRAACFYGEFSTWRSNILVAKIDAALVDYQAKRNNHFWKVIVRSFALKKNQERMLSIPSRQRTIWPLSKNNLSLLQSLAVILPCTCWAWNRTRCERMLRS